MASASFDYSKWSALFPYLANGGVTNAVASVFFDVAELLFNNTNCSPIDDLEKRATFLYFVVAHLARLNGYPIAPGGTAQPNELVGRIGSATEGTVSVSLASEYMSTSASEAWWRQTQEGATFWTLTAQFRAFRVFTPKPRYFGSSIRATQAWRR